MLLIQHAFAKFRSIILTLHVARSGLMLAAYKASTALVLPTGMLASVLAACVKLSIHLHAKNPQYKSAWKAKTVIART